jgi:hypothetical protein
MTKLADRYRYLMSIRNPAKRLYAARYWDFLQGLRPIEPNAGTLSSTAAQAVRMQLRELCR